MRRWLPGAALGLTLAMSAVACNKPKPAEPPPKQDETTSPAEQLAAIKKEVLAAQDEYFKAATELDDKKKEDVEKAEKLYKEFSKKQEEGFAKALEIARADPKSDAGFAALEWLLTNPRAYYTDVGKSAMELTAEYHAGNPKVAPAVRSIANMAQYQGSSGHPAVTALLKAVAEKNPDRTAKGYAAMGLAGQSVGDFHTAEHKNGPDVEKLAAETETKLEALAKDYGDLSDVGDWAKGELFALRNLRVGKVAPDIEGEDVDGVKFKLSDYRGKVVVLDFWGDW